MSASGGELEVLRCGQCGAPVPLGDGDRVPCPGCGAQVEVPEPYRVARDAARLDAQGQALCARLGAPPGTLQRVLASGAYVWIFLLLLPFAVQFLSGLAHLLVLGPIELVARVYLIDVLSPTAYGAALGGAIFVVIAPLAVIGSHGRRQVRKRRALQASLAARPPATPGGPATCRACGAPLAVPQGAVGVRCSYCRADNLVALPEDWVASAKVERATLRTQIADAAKEEERSRIAIRRGTIIRLVLLAALAAGYYAFFRIAFGNRSVWREAMVTPRTFDPYFPSYLPETNLTGDTLSAGEPGQATFAQNDDGRCVAFYTFAARHGERVVVQLGPTAPPVVARLHHITSPDHGGGASVRPGGSTELRVPRSGYFQLGLEGSPPCHAVTLTLSISPRR